MEKIWQVADLSRISKDLCHNFYRSKWRRKKYKEKKIPEINCSREMLQLFQRNASIVPASNCFWKERETVIWENGCNERKESVFLSLSEGKHFPLIKLLFFFILTGINFPLTSFPYCNQTWENEENKF